MPDMLLEVKDLNVTFISKTKGAAPLQAVRGISFALEKGQILGIVGESGSGKSVSAMAIPRLLPKTAKVDGDITFLGKKIGIVFQEPGRVYDPLQKISSAFLETFRVDEPGISESESLEKAIALLNECGLQNAADRIGGFPHAFSGGELQRISIALSLAQNPELLIADEPTTALNVTLQAKIVTLLKELSQKRKIAVMFISHDIHLIASISDTILVMYAGLVMERGKTADVLHAARHPYTKALLASMPEFGKSYKTTRLAAIPGTPCDPHSPEPGCPFAPRCPERKSACTDAGYSCC
ncbi:MAG: ABC transporter ATP-binding protein [Treponemataceae bacterium]|nr:MAG: ABC transporter ATP-binding protein [Treponemataceae bacterium]